MNLILLVMAGGLVFVAAYMANTWVTSHALAVAAGDQWAIQASGWPALWPMLAVGLLAGAAAGLALGLVLSGKLAEALSDKRTDALKRRPKRRSRLSAWSWPASVQALTKKNPAGGR